MRQSILIILFLFPLFFMPAASADTVQLKDGTKITGDIIREDEEVVVISREGGSFICSVSREKIENIEKSTREETKEEKGLATKIKDLWHKFVGYFAGPEVKEVAGEKEREKQKEYLLEKYDKEVRAAEEARKRREARTSREKEKKKEAAKSRRGTCPKRRCGR